MVLTIVVCLVMTFVTPIATLCLSVGPYVSIITLVPTICVLCALKSQKHKYPANYQLLFAFTFFMSLDIGAVCSIYNSAGLGEVILEALFITVALFGGLSLYTFWSGRDFSFMYGFLFGSLCALVAVGLLGLIFPALVNNIVYPLAGSLIFCGYIVYDTWKLTKVFGYDDYIIAAIELYLDIINLFLYILELLGRSS